MNTKANVAATIMRVVLGMILLVHGIVKFQQGIEGIVGWFASIGLPGPLAYGVALFEIIGGAALILGLWTRYASIITVLLMAGATITAKLPGGLLGNGQGAGYEFDLALLVIALFFAITNQSGYGADQLLSKKQSAAS